MKRSTEIIVRNNDTAIVGLGKDPSALIVQKSYPLIMQLRAGLPLQALKVLDLYLSRINVKQQDKTLLFLKKEDIVKLLSLKTLRQSDYDALKKALYDAEIKVVDEDSGIEFRIRLFDSHFVFPTHFPYDFALCCSDKSKHYFFGIGPELHYAKYYLHEVIAIRSRHAYLLFSYLEKNRSQKVWVESVDNLRDILNCEKESAKKKTKKTYVTFANFHNRMFIKAKEELEQVTDCRFNYQLIRTGKAVTDIKFEILPRTKPVSRKKSVVLGEMVSKSSIQNDVDVSKYPIAQIKTVLPGFSENKVVQIVKAALANEFWKEEYSYEPDMHKRLIYFIQDMWTIMMEQENVENKFGYLRRIIENYKPKASRSESKE